MGGGTYAVLRRRENDKPSSVHTDLPFPFLSARQSFDVQEVNVLVSQLVVRFEPVMLSDINRDFLNLSMDALHDNGLSRFRNR